MCIKVRLVLNVIQTVTNKKKAMKNRYIILILLTLFCSNIFGQDTDLTITKGKVTFVTAANVYVQFDNTKNIKVGDSLQIEGSKTNCLLVKNKSSKSVVCIIVNGCIVKKDAVVIFKFLPIETINKNIKVNIAKIDSSLKKTGSFKKVSAKNKEYISGKLSVASYSNFYANSDNKHRIITRFSMNANHINNSNFSFETYLNYRKEVLAQPSKYASSQKPFKVYNFALKYDATPTLSVVLGRRINNKTSSLGAIDGLQIEKQFGKNYVGVITGFRPDLTDFNFNASLFQYGAYVGRKTSSASIFSETTLGIIEQRNSGNIDRRYTYFQHSSNLFSSLNLFSSFELDIYNKVNGVVSNNFRLTNLYMSARYKFSRKFNLNVSYNSRKRIIYYETFRTQIEDILANDLARQGLRFRVNAKPFKYVNTGLSYSARFQSDNQNKSDNINAYVSMYRIPKFGGSVSLNYNRNTSNYLESNIVSIRHSRTLFENKLSADFYFRFVNYNYTVTEANTQQYYFGTNLSLYLSRNLRFSVYAEYVQSDINNNYRINTKLVKRFNNKKKKKHYAY